MVLAPMTKRRTRKVPAEPIQCLPKVRPKLDRVAQIGWLGLEVAAIGDREVGVPHFLATGSHRPRSDWVRVNLIEANAQASSTMSATC
jgi:hypothetical protein